MILKDLTLQVCQWRKEKKLRDILRAFKDHSFLLTAQKLQASAEGIVSSQSKFSPNIDFKSTTDFSNDMRTLVALTNNALLLTGN